MTSFPRLLRESACILGEGAVIERLRRGGGPGLDPHILNSALIYEPAGRRALAAIYRQYLDIGRAHGLPMLLSTPTWRASGERTAAAGWAGRDVNGDNFRFLAELRRGTGGYARRVAVGGLMSCRGNAYDPAEALEEADARDFHGWQAQALAAALADTGKDYVISFIVRPEGTLLDGTPLKDAVAAIDAGVRPGPLAYLVNCTHASFFKAALNNGRHSSARARERVVGLLANTAALNPEELDESAELVGEDPEVFGRSLAGLHRDLGLKVLGGCCGTDGRHIRCLAQELSASAARRGEEG